LRNESLLTVSDGDCSCAAPCLPWSSRAPTSRPPLRPLRGAPMTAVVPDPVAVGVRTATPRRYLMFPPTYFAVEYAINPWMLPGTVVDRDRAVAQWEVLRRTYLDLGHRVDVLAPVPGLPDMVYAANGATVVGGT